jgi:hypothetical protein
VTEGSGAAGLAADHVGGGLHRQPHLAVDFLLGADHELLPGE